MSNKTMEPAQQLAQDILKLSFNLLRVRLRFLDLALSGLRPHQAPGASHRSSCFVSTVVRPPAIRRRGSLTAIPVRLVP